MQFHPFYNDDDDDDDDDDMGARETLGIGLEAPSQGVSDREGGRHRLLNSPGQLFEGRRRPSSPGCFSRAAL